MICANCGKEFKGKIYLNDIEYNDKNRIFNIRHNYPCIICDIECDFCEHCGVFQMVEVE